MAEGMVEAVELFLQSAQWEYMREEDAPIYFMHYYGESADWPCACLVLEEQDRVAFLSRVPATMPAEVRAAATEFITRVNYGLGTGSFEMDLDDGDLRFKTTLDTGGDPLTQALLGPLVWLNIATMERYLPALLEVMKGADPRAALDRVATSAE